jgi:spore coat protein U-like protein
VTSNVAISATIIANCTITTKTQLAFGTYDPLVTNASTALNGTGAVTVACAKNTAARVSLDQGLHGAGGTCTAPTRKMQDAGTATLSYDLYQDGGHTTVWGCTSPTNDKAYTAANKNPVDLTIYGTIPQNQDVENGNYTDTVVATITF